MIVKGKVLTIFILVFLFFFIGAISLLYGKNISIANMLEYLEILTTVGSITLGVMGVWLSLVWNHRKGDRSEDTNISYIKTASICAVSIIIVFLFLKLTYPVFIQISFLSNYQILLYIRSFVYFLSCILTLLIMVPLVMFVFSFDFFTFDDADKKNKDDEYNTYFNSTNNKS